MAARDGKFSMLWEERGSQRDVEAEGGGGENGTRDKGHGVALEEGRDLL